MMGKARIVSKAAKGTAEVVVSQLVASAAKLAADKLEKRQTYIKLPDVKGMSIDEATRVLTKFGFTFSTVLVEANKKYAGKRSNTVFKTAPRGNGAVAPETFVKIFYANQNVITASDTLAAAAVEKKTARVAATKGLINQIGHTVKTTTVGVTKQIRPSQLFKKKAKSDSGLESQQEHGQGNPEA